jgi:mxaJ protein
VWGPLAAYFAAREPEPLRVAPVQPSSDGPMLPMAWDISMAVRSDDGALLEEVGRVLERRRAEVNAILAAYGVPRADESHGSAGAMP